MITNREAIYLFRKFEEDTTGRLSDDAGVSNKAILEFLTLTRASIIREYKERGKDLSPQLFQTISCIGLSETDRNDCDLQPKSGCFWLKTDTVLPTYITLSSVTAGTAGNNINFNPTGWDKIGYKMKSRVVGNIYTTKDIGKGTHLYIHNKDFLKNVSVTAIFEKPIEASAICNKDCKCDLLDQPFYVSRDLMGSIITSAWNTLSQVKRLSSPDVFNNAGKDTVTPQ